MHRDDKSTRADAADRRSVLKFLGLGAATGGVALAAAEPAAAAEKPADDTGSHYRETEHVKTYYELAKF